MSAVQLTVLTTSLNKIFDDNLIIDKFLKLCSEGALFSNFIIRKIVPFRNGSREKYQPVTVFVGSHISEATTSISGSACLSYKIPDP